MARIERNLLSGPFTELAHKGLKLQSRELSSGDLNWSVHEYSWIVDRWITIYQLESERVLHVTVEQKSPEFAFDCALNLFSIFFDREFEKKFPPPWAQGGESPDDDEDVWGDQVWSDRGFVYQHGLPWTIPDKTVIEVLSEVYDASFGRSRRQTTFLMDTSFSFSEVVQANVDKSAFYRRVEIQGLLFENKFREITSPN